MPLIAGARLGPYEIVSAARVDEVSDGEVGRTLLSGPPSGTLFPMTIKARVNAGRLVVDEPTDLPDGTELELLSLDPGDWLDETDRAALHKALRESDADVAAGRLVDADEVLKELKSR